MKAPGIPPIVHKHKRPEEPSDIFRKISVRMSEIVGTRWAFVVSICIIITWVLSGKLFGYSNTWQLVINTFTTIVTFLMVFLIQNTQNRDAKATQIKLDEIIRAIDPARDSLIDVEDQSDKKIDQLIEEFRDIRKEEEKKLNSQ